MQAASPENITQRKTKHSNISHILEKLISWKDILNLGKGQNSLRITAYQTLFLLYNA